MFHDAAFRFRQRATTPRPSLASAGMREHAKSRHWQGQPGTPHRASLN